MFITSIGAFIHGVIYYKNSGNFVAILINLAFIFLCSFYEAQVWALVGD